MSQQVDEPSLARARQAMERAAWGEAFELLSQADRDGGLGPGELPVLADAAYLAGHPDVSRTAWERIHAAALEAGDTLAAGEAAVRVAAYYLDAVLYTPLRAWLQRAERLLEGQEDTPAHGMLAWLASYEAVAHGDHEASLRWARRAVEIGTELGDKASRAMGRICEGRGLVMAGHVREGLALLDEAVVAGTAGDLDAYTTSVVFCSAICTWQALTEYERAEEWTGGMDQWCSTHDVGGMHGRCRVHRAQLLRLRGRSQRAEDEARQAVVEMRTYSRGELGWPTYELGQIRLRLGDLAGAEEAFLEAHELGWDPQPGLALVRLAQGDVETAAASIRQALDDPIEAPSFELPPNSDLQRAPRLTAQVEIALVAGDRDRARWAADELTRIAEVFGTKALRGTAAAARGAVELAEENTEAARPSFQEAVRLWKELDAPYETARARLGLAEAHRAAGNQEAALLELSAARSTFERLGARLDAERASRALGELRVTRSSAAQREDKTFMFTDIVKSTDLVGILGDEAWGHLVRWHNETLARLARDHRGDVIRTTGDGFFVAFAQGEDAVECAVAIQRALTQHRREQGFSPDVRIGLHRAEATREGLDWSGVGVHAAARIGALAEGGEILVSCETLEETDSSRAVSERRTVSLKGIADPVEVVAVAWR